VKAATIVALALIVSAGCKGTYPARYEPQPRQESQKVILQDSKLKALKIVREVEPIRLKPGGQLQIEVVMVNTSNDTLKTDVKVQFLDSKGGILEETSWQPEFFPRSSEKSIRKNSIGPEAADYRILIRRQE